MNLNKKNKNFEKLYSIFKSLSSYISDQDELGEVIAYSVLEGLINFESKTGSSQELEFEQVKKIYSKLTDILDNYKRNPNYYALLELKQDVDPFLNSNKNLEIPQNQKYLIEKIIPELIESKKHYEDKLRRSGKKLYDLVSTKGELYRNVDSLRSDYKSLEDAFDV